MLFRRRLALFLLALIGAVQITTMAVVYSYARHAASERGVRELSLAGDALQLDLDIIADRVTSGVEVLALDFGLRTSIAEQDRASALSALRNHGRRIKARRMMLIDLDGKVAADTANPEAPAAKFPYAALIDAAWRDGSASALAKMDGQTNWTIAAPIEAPDLIGYVVAFAPVDSSLLNALGEASGAPVTISLVAREPKGQWRVIASGGESVRAEGAALDFDPAVARGGRAARGGGAFLYAATPLATAETSSPIYALHEYRLTDVFAGNWDLFGPLLAILGAGLFVAAGGALAIARGVAAPLERLASAAVALRGGDYETRIAVDGGAREFQELGGALDAAARAVRAREQALIETNRSLEAARDEARAADRAKSQFIANMSHELRTPLNAIIGFADVIRREAAGPIGAKDYLQYAGYIATGGRGLLDLHNAILDMARIDAGRFDLRMDSSDFREIADDAIHALAPMAAAKGVALTLSAAGGRAPIDCDHAAMVKAVRHIAHNAVKFTPEGGAVELTVGQEGADCFIAVRDTGIGMDEAEIARLMRPFQRANADYATEFPGAGLGLPVAESIVRLHGGSLSISTAPMKGATVVIRAPARRQAGIAQEAA